MRLEEYTVYCSPWILAKLGEREITAVEVEEAFSISSPHYPVDNRPRHRTKPLTRWFIAPTAAGRLLKVAFVPYADRKIAKVKTAYEPEDWEIELYESER